MFKFLKDKLHQWKEKVIEEFSASDSLSKSPNSAKEQNAKRELKEEEKPAVSKESSKKETSKKKTAKKTPEKKTRAPKIDKKEREISEKIIEEVKKEQPIESPEEKFEKKEKGFFKKLFSHEEKEETEELQTSGQEEGERSAGGQGRGFFDKFKKKITEEKFEELFTELQMIMLQNNVAYEAVEYIKNKLEKELVGKNLSEVSLEEKLREALEEILINPPNLIKEIKEKLKEKKPYVIAFVGINGSGKTTTIAKITRLLQKEKLSVCLAAGDTFRAAAIEQLQVHADKLNVPLIKKDYNADPASVGFEAIAYAKKHAIDVVLIDTAGRLNTKESLMKEMEKIIRVCQPDKKIFLGESITGNDATEQARSFNDHISIDGIVLSKADIDEKGGTALSVSYITKKPIYFLGTGQTYDDLEVFNKDKMIKSLGL